MPLFNKFLSTTRKREIITNKNQVHCNLPLKIGITNHDKNALNFGPDQVRILLFRECEWRGRKLLFDSVTVGHNNNNNESNINDNKSIKRANDNNSCPRNGNGLPQENEKNPCDNVNLLSEMIFGTVAMTYRGALFKVHTFDSPRCVMCTKVFPTSDHNQHKQSGKCSDDTLGNCVNFGVNFDVNSSNCSSKNTLSMPSSGNYSANSLRKSSTCSSTCSGWDIDIPLLGSSQSFESNSSSGFGSLSSLRRRWLRSMSTSLNHSETDELFQFQSYSDNLNNNYDISRRRHKTRLGLAVLIKLIPGQERQMEIKLLEHAAQLESMINRLCYSCIDPIRSKINSNNHSLLIKRMYQASYKCKLRLFHLLGANQNNNIPSIWHEILLNTTDCMEIPLNTLYDTFQQMCQLLNNIDTKSTNFFLSTVVTAVLTYHLGWVNTVIPPRDKTLVEYINKRFPYNPLWGQLNELYGTIGNPSKFVNTVIYGDDNKVELINGILKFLSYFIRSTIVKRNDEIRDNIENDVSDAISIIQRKRRKNNSLIINSMNKLCLSKIHNNSNNNGESSNIKRSNSSSLKLIKSIDTECEGENLSINNDNKSSIDLNIPRLRKINSLYMNIDNENVNGLKSDKKISLKLELNQDDLINNSQLFNDYEKMNTSNTVNKIVNQIVTDTIDNKKNIPAVTSEFDELMDNKNELREHELLSEPPKLSFHYNQCDNNYDLNKLHVNTIENNEIYSSHNDDNNIKMNSVLFTLGDDEKSFKTINKSSLRIDNVNCQCSFAFTRVPSTSAQLPEGVLRKIIQRNFPESSKSIQRQTQETSFIHDKTLGYCSKCNGNGNNYYDDNNDKLLLETPTNATEVLRTCGNSVNTPGSSCRSSSGGTRSRCLDTLDELLEANDVIVLPMPRSKNISAVTKDFNDISGFTDTLIKRNITKTTRQFINNNDNIFDDSHYTSGLVIQGLTNKRKKQNDHVYNNDKDKNKYINIKENLIDELKEDVIINGRYPIVDQPLSESLCILADVDDWQVGIISNNMLSHSPLIHVGMSRLVSNMLEAFVYLWTKYQSPVHCLNILECKLREMWLRSDALAELLITTDVCNINLTNLMSTLDIDAADIPLLLAVATTHSPQIAQRIGLTFT